MEIERILGVEVIAPEDGDPGRTQYKFFSRSTGASVALASDLSGQPDGLFSAALKIGIKRPDIYDFAVVKLPERGPAAGVFTRNRCASPAVQIDRAHLADGFAQALVVISKNANVFTPTDRPDAEQVVATIADALSVRPADVLISCTGVIGVPLPVEKIVTAARSVPGLLAPGLSMQVAEAILTTDRGPKVCSARSGEVALAGMTKGAGMIEPDMATLLTYFFTNLAAPPARLQDMLSRICERTFNSISVDTDTSTSDSIILFSTGEVPATPDRLADLEAALAAGMVKLSRDVVFQAEGATKLIEVSVRQAASDLHARQVAKFVVNSPLVKTAVFGADPNWGRIVMAIGKPGQDSRGLLDPAKVRIAFDGDPVFEHGRIRESLLSDIAQRIKRRKKVTVTVDLGEGTGEWTAWGCDLSYDYVKTNSEYTS